MSWDATKFGFHLTLCSVFEKKGFFFNHSGRKRNKWGTAEQTTEDLIWFETDSAHFSQLRFESSKISRQESLVLGHLCLKTVVFRS